MPVEFLTSDQKSSYGQFSGQPNEMQLTRYFHLDEADLDFVFKRRGAHNILGVALQLGCARFLGNFISSPSQIPINVKWFVARQLDISDVTILAKYAQRETTKREHAALIRKQYNYREFSWPWTFRLNRLLYIRSWVSNERPSLLFDLATSWLIQHKILLPGRTTLTRLIAEVRKKANNRLWKKLSALPSAKQIIELETILQIPDGTRTSHFDNFRKGPVTISGPAFNKAVKRYLELKEFGMAKLDFSNIPPIRLKSIARHAGMISMHKIARMPSYKKTAILVAFAKAYEIIALDEALDILDLLITDIAGEAKKVGKKKRLRTLKDLDKSALALANICSLLLKSEANDQQLRATIFDEISREQILESINTVHQLVRPNNNFKDEMVEQYGRVRLFLPTLLCDLEFKSAPAGKVVLDAFNYLCNYSDSRKQYLENPPLDIISQQWKKLVFDKGERVIRKSYALCFLDKMQDSLRRRDIYVEKSDRWGDTRAKLLQGKAWLANRTQICRSLGHPLHPQEAVSALVRQLDSTYKQVADNFDNNRTVEVDLSGKKVSLTISQFDRLEEPPSLTLLSKQVESLIPNVDLTELLLEIDAHTHFTKEFTHVSESNSRAENLSVSICAVLVAEACNIGFEPLIKHQVPALTRHRLNWVKQNYLREETLVKANSKLVDYQSTLSLAKKWGGGEVASADGLRFVTPVRTINAGPNRKYFGSSRGITWYNFVSDQFSGFHGIVIPGTLRDSIFVLEGLLEQQTGLKPIEIMTDTAGTSDMVFGLFWLLGYQFSPRLADAGESTFWRIDKEADYGVFNDLAQNCIKPGKIEQHWDDMMRIAGSLKLGTVQASELIKTLLKSDRPSSLAQAIIEAGRINKTLYLLNYVDDEDYRRRILVQLNRGEGRHAVARAICHGQRGEIRKRYKEGQEDQLGALGLVTNALVLWNTIYMQESLSHLKQQGECVNEEDEARLSPLCHKHINMLGHYSFFLAEQVLNGQLRPLKEPFELEESS